MASTRDEFSAATREQVARRVSYRCSNPNCRVPTIGPADADDSSLSIGVAAHISAASVGGPRYDPHQSPEERKSIDNAIWLCQSCSRLVDVDELSHPRETLRSWKQFGEAAALVEVRGFQLVRGKSFVNLESKMPELVAEMRADLIEHPFVREFILKGNGWAYNGSSNNPIFHYCFEDHESLKGKLTIMQNYGAVVEITWNNVDRFEFTEEFVEFLLQQ